MPPYRLTARWLQDYFDREGGKLYGAPGRNFRRLSFFQTLCRSSLPSTTRTLTAQSSAPSVRWADWRRISSARARGERPSQPVSRSRSHWSSSPATPSDTCTSHVPGETGTVWGGGSHLSRPEGSASEVYRATAVPCFR